MFLTDRNAGWGTAFTSVPASYFQRKIINKLDILAFSGLYYSNPPKSQWLIRAKWFSLALGQLQLCSRLCSPLPQGQCFILSVDAGEKNMYSGDLYSISVWIFWVKFMRLFKSPVSFWFVGRGQGQREPGSVFYQLLRGMLKFPALIMDFPYFSL